MTETNGHHGEQHDEQGTFWERPLENEPHTAFMAFTHYRDAGITRSLRQAAAAFYQAQLEPDDPRRDTEGTPGAAALRRFKERSRTWMWQARVEAYDAEESRPRSLEMQQERIEMYGQHLKLVRLGLNVSAQTLYDCMRGESYFPPSQVPSLVNSITQLHRLSVGEATERVEVSDPDAGPQIPDLSKLSDREIDALYEIVEKLNSGD